MSYAWNLDRQERQEIADELMTQVQEVKTLLDSLMKNANDGQELTVRIFSEVFCDFQIKSYEDFEPEIKEKNEHCDCYDCEEMLDIFVRDNEGGELGAYQLEGIGFVINYIDRTKMRFTDNKNDFVFEDLVIESIGHKDQWGDSIQQNRLDSLIDILKSESFEDKLSMLLRVTGIQTVKEEV
jgi:hypothetical protein